MPDSIETQEKQARSVARKARAIYRGLPCNCHCSHNAAEALEEAAKAVGFEHYGIEGNAEYTYLNVGDSYAVTVCFMDNGEKFIVSSLGDLEEQLQSQREVPSIDILYDLCRYAKGCIEDDSRAFPDDDFPSIQLTVGIDGKGGIGYQTGDNSYTGGAYGYPHWGIAYIDRRTNCREAAKALQSELSDSLYS